MMRVGRSKEGITLQLRDMILDNAKGYKYLSEVLNNREILEDHLDQLVGKIEVSYQLIITIAEDNQFKKIKMQAIWELVEICIIPLLTYSCEPE